MFEMKLSHLHYEIELKLSQGLSLYLLTAKNSSIEKNELVSTLHA